MTKESAVQSAGAKLEQLNDTMRRLVMLQAAAVVLLAVLAACASYAVVEYVRLKLAMGQVAAGMERSFKAPIVTKQGLRKP